jgi:hypothetical protein
MSLFFYLLIPLDKTEDLPQTDGSPVPISATEAILFTAESWIRLTIN